MALAPATNGIAALMSTLRAQAPDLAARSLKEAEPELEKLITFVKTGGKGVHRMTWWAGDIAWVTAGFDDYSNQILVALSLADPSRPVEVGRWWLPGMRIGAGEVPDWIEPVAPRSRRHLSLLGRARYLALYAVGRFWIRLVSALTYAS